MKRRCAKIQRTTATFIAQDRIPFTTKILRVVFAIQKSIDQGVAFGITIVCVELGDFVQGWQSASNVQRDAPQESRVVAERRRRNAK